jgi:hypothetical protein
MMTTTKSPERAILQTDEAAQYKALGEAFRGTDFGRFARERAAELRRNAEAAGRMDQQH